MLRDYFLNKIETAIEKAVENKQLGQMSEYKRGSLPVEKPKNPEFGDLAINVSSLARNAKIAPPAIANAIIELIEKEDNQYSVIGGFINFKVGNTLLEKVLKEIFSKKSKYGKPDKINSEKIILEYISANPTGPFHIGHGRWAAMGSTLANLLKFYGHEVYQEFYINDAGSQIQKLGRSLIIRVKQQLNIDADFPADEIERKNYYPGEYLIPVAKEFIKDKKEELEAVFNDPDKIDLAVYCDYAKDYEERVQREFLEQFRVKFDNFYSELTLHNSGKVDKCINELKKSKKLYKQDGAIWFKSSEYGDDQDRVIKKADGSNTYLTADIAYHVDKLKRGFDRMINIWGADHHGYIARVKASLEALGYDPNKLEILLGQLVNLIIDGNEVRMGKRKNMVTLEELTNEVGVDATRYWMIMRNIDTTLDFDIELAKRDTDDNPVFYVQYAHARACSIIRNATQDKLDTKTGETTKAILTADEFDDLISKYDGTIAKTSVNDGRKLILKLDEFNQIIKNSAETRQVYTICRYVQELATEFHSFYTSTRVLTEDKETTKARLILVWSFKTVLANALKILAVSAPERM